MVNSGNMTTNIHQLNLQVGQSLFATFIVLGEAVAGRKRRAPFARA